MRYAMVAVCCFVMAFGGDAHAHPGGTDSNGCHTNHKTGVYHCHNSQPAAPSRLSHPSVKLSSSIKPPKNLDTKVKEAQVFRYKYKPSETRSYATIMRQELAMEPTEGGSQPGMTTVSTIKSMVNMKTQKVLPDGMAVIETSYSEFDLKLNQNGVDMKDEQTEPLENVLKQIRSTSKMTSRGESKDFQYEGIDPSMKQMTESMKSAMVGLTPALPEKGLKVGQAWRQVVPMEIAQGPVKLALRFNVTYTFLGYSNVKRRRLAVFQTDVDATVNEMPGSAPDMKFSVTGKGKGFGCLYFDNRVGELVKSELDMNQITSMSIESPRGNQTMKMIQKTNTAMVLQPQVAPRKH